MRKNLGGVLRLFSICLVLLLLASPVASAAGELIGLNQNYGEDPRTSCFFCWQTTEDASYAALQYRRADASPDDAPETVLAETELIETDMGLRASHKVYLRELEPDTEYRYRVVLPSRGYYSEYRAFSTQPETVGYFSFLHFADSQCGRKKDYLEYWGGTLGAAMKKYPDVDFLLHTGDMVDRPDSEEEHWDGFFEAAEAVFPNSSLLTLLGNHEHAWEGTPFFQAHFALDEPAGIPFTYSYDLDVALLLCLNSSGDPELLAEWVAREIEEKGEGKWLIVAQHIGLYGGEHQEDSATKKLRKALLPVYDKYQVDLVLQGHDHIYMRSYPMRNDESQLPEMADLLRAGLGTVYLIPYTSGSKVYYDNAQSPWMQVYWAPEREQRYELGNRAYAHISVDAGSIDVRVHRVDGLLMDKFTLRK